MKNRVFFPQAALDQWIVDGSVEIQEGELTIASAGRRYRLAEAVRVLGEVSGTGDGHDLVGRVKARIYLEQLGAEIVQTSMLLGESAYDVEPGWLGIPMGSLSAQGIEALTPNGAAGQAVGAPATNTDEDALGQFLTKNV